MTEYTEAERREAVLEISREWPYFDPEELWSADGDSPENVAVFLQMKSARCERELAEARDLLGSFAIGYSPEHDSDNWFGTSPAMTAKANEWLSRNPISQSAERKG